MNASNAAVNTLQPHHDQLHHEFVYNMAQASTINTVN